MVLQLSSAKPFAIKRTFVTTWLVASLLSVKPTTFSSNHIGVPLRCERFSCASLHLTTFIALI